jgi:hypothetical protein
MEQNTCWEANNSSKSACYCVCYHLVFQCLVVHITFVYRIKYIVVNLINDVFLYHFLLCLCSNITEQYLDMLFGKYGQIVQKNLLKDKLTGMPRGVAFVRLVVLSFFCSFCILSSFLGLFTKLWKMTLSLSCLSAWNCLAPTGQIFMKLEIWEFLKKSVANIVVWFRSGKNKFYCIWSCMYRYDRILLNEL